MRTADLPPVVVVPTNEEEPGEADAQCPAELVRLDRVSLVDDADQGRPLGREPAGGVVDHSVDDCLVRSPAGPGLEGSGEGGTGHAPSGLLSQGEPTPSARSTAAPVGFRLVCGNQLPGVGAQQVMEAVTQRSGGISTGHVQQLHIDQGVDQLLSRGLRDVEQRCGDPGAKSRISSRASLRKARRAVTSRLS